MADEVIDPKGEPTMLLFQTSIISKCFLILTIISTDNDISHSSSKKFHF